MVLKTFEEKLKPMTRFCSTPEKKKIVGALGNSKETSKKCVEQS